MIVIVIAVLPMIPLFKEILSDTPDEDMLYHISGEFAIRWMTAVLTLTPFFILFGVTNLFVRQAMGISTAIWSLLHFSIFLIHEGILDVFTELSFILGFLALLMMLPLLLTSNRRSMRRLKANWKKLQRLAYLIGVLGLLHVILLNKTWLVYTIIVILGFVLRLPAVRKKVIQIRS